MARDLGHGVLHLDPHFQDSPLATRAQIAMAIIVRQAMNDGDTAKTAEQLAEILEPLGIDLSDIRQGLPWHKLSDGDPS